MEEGNLAFPAMSPLRSPSPQSASNLSGPKLPHGRRWPGLVAAAALSFACSSQHWAPVQSSQVSPPRGPKVLHQGRLIVDLDRGAETQCVSYEKYSPVCYSNLKQALAKALLDGTWAAFPNVQRGTARDLRPGDYLLQVEIALDALPPDASGPGWSAGAKTRFRVLRDGKIISEATLASRSRADFAYGAPLGAGASEVIEATALHIAERLSQIPESLPRAKKTLPKVASRELVSATRSSRLSKSDLPGDDVRRSNGAPAGDGLTAPAESASEVANESPPADTAETHVPGDDTGGSPSDASSSDEAVLEGAPFAPPQ